jgi:hypothetical protein
MIGLKNVGSPALSYAPAKACCVGEGGLRTLAGAWGQGCRRRGQRGVRTLIWRWCRCVGSEWGGGEGEKNLRGNPGARIVKAGGGISASEP